MALPLLFSAHAAQADFTANELADALIASLQKSGGVAFTYKSAALDGSDGVVINGLTFGEAGDRLTLDEVVLSDIEEPVDGNFIIGEIAVPGSTFSPEDGASVTIGDATVSDFQVITAPSDEYYDGFYSSAEVDGLTVSVSGQEIVSVGEFLVSISPWSPGASIASATNISSIVVDVNALPPGPGSQALVGMGYEEIRADLNAEGKWNTETGAFDLQDTTISVDDIADLTLTAKIGGYTMELMESLRDMQSQMNADNQQAMGMAMFGLLQQLEVESLSISLKDESITGRALDFAGSQQGMNGDSMAAMLKGLLPLGLAQLGNPEFAQNAQAEIGEFIDDPDRITITAEPEAPVPFAVLAGSAMAGNPAQLLTTLNVQVEAE